MKNDNPPIRLLLIEDDELTREFLAIQIAAENYLVETAESGDAALRQLKKKGHLLPDVVLTDLQMPGTCGVELARQLRFLASAAGVPEMVLLVMSASHPDERLSAGYDSFLSKPFTMEQLAAAVSSQGHQPSEAQEEHSDSELATASHILDPTIFGKLQRSLPAPQLQQLYALCITDAQIRIERMRLAADSGDDNAFRAEAHAMKGGSSMVGALELQRLAAEAETFGIQHANYVVSFEEMQQACERLRSMLIAHESRANS